MMNLTKSFLFIIICFFCFQIGYGQDGSANVCIDAQPLCGSSEFYYPNTSGYVASENGPNYGCLRGQPNPSWFYFQIENAGDLQFKIEQSTAPGGTPNLDLDFIIYGPFNDPRSPCFSDLTAQNIIDCSYSNEFVEFVDVQNAQQGEYFLMLITNFSRGSGFITVTQTAGAATSNCVFLKDPVIENLEVCEGDSVNLNAFTSNASKYIWYKGDGSGNFRVVNGIDAASYDVLSSNNYKAEAFDINNVLLEKYEFNVLFYQKPVVSTSLSDYVLCDVFDANDGFAEFDLRTKDMEVLNGLDITKFSVSYYANATNAMLGFPELPNIYINEIEREEIYARIDNIQSSSVSCFDIGKFNIEIKLLPEASLDAEYLLCVDTNGTVEITSPPLIDTGLNASLYRFSWYLNGEILLNEDEPAVYPSQEGVYSVEITERDTGCSVVTETNVITSSPPSISATVTTLAFANTHRIETSATSNAQLQDFQFSLDGGPWKDSGVFNNVTFGEHEITVRDINGCGFTSKTVMVIDYPHYFTPNGDGVNDTWNIVGLSSQQQAKVYVYNRYGKLLKQISPSSLGWDGSFNGAIMASNDYWFTIEYIEPRNGKLNTFKAHFTLKR